MEKCSSLYCIFLEQSNHNQLVSECCENYLYSYQIKKEIISIQLILLVISSNYLNNANKEKNEKEQID